MRRAFSQLVVIVVLAVAAPSASAASFYVPEYNVDQVLAFGMTQGSSGPTLTPQPGSPFSIPSGGLTAFATTPDGKKGVAGYLFSPGIRGMSIGPDGAITSAQSKISLGVNGVYNVAVTPDSKFAYAATRGASTPGVRAYSIAENGDLTQLGGSPFGTSWEFFDVAVTPDQKFLYGTIGMELAVFSINANGTLTFVGNTGGVTAQWVSV